MTHPIQRSIRTTPVLAGLLLLLFGAVDSLGARMPENWQLELGGRSSPLPVLVEEEGPLFALSPIVEALGLQIERVDRRAFLVTAPEGGRLLCQARRSVALVGEEVVLMERAPRLERDELFVPAGLVTRALGRLLGRELAVEVEERRLVVDAPRAWDSRWRRAGDRAELSITHASLERPRLHREGRTAVIEIPGGLRAPDEISPALGEVEIDRGRAGTILRLRPAPGYTVVPGAGSDTLRLGLLPAALVQGPPAQESEPTGPRESDGEAEAKGVGLSLVVLDPGHGGAETGAVGRGGLQEKEVVLNIARALRERLEAEGVEVALTREEDREMPLGERTSFANQLGADLFVSLHANASPAADVVGSETFFLSREATDELSRKIAAIESDTLGLGGEKRVPGALQMTLWEMAQSQYLQESQRLAARIQKELNQLAGTPDRGVRQAPLTVLMGATMPAVLVEVGFLSNPREEGKLADPSYRKKIVEALARAVQAFGEERRRRRTGASPP